MMPLVRTIRGEMIEFKDFPQEIHPERLWVEHNLCDFTLDSLRILDLGCGTHKTRPWFIGVDILPGADYQCSIDHLPFQDRSIDKIVSRHSLEHVLDPIKALREWRRVLRPEGKVVIVLPDEGSVPTMQPALSGGMHLHAYDMASFRNLIESTGMFTIEKLEIVLEDWSFGAVLAPR